MFLRYEFGRHVFLPQRGFTAKPRVANEVSAPWECEAIQQINPNGVVQSWILQRLVKWQNVCPATVEPRWGSFCFSIISPGCAATAATLGFVVKPRWGKPPASIILETKRTREFLNRWFCSLKMLHSVALRGGKSKNSQSLRDKNVKGQISSQTCV